MPNIQGANSKEYISSLAFMDQRDYLADVLDVTNEQATMVDALELTGRTKITKVQEYIHTENVQLFKNCVIVGMSVTAGRIGLSAGHPVDFTMGANNTFLPVVGELAMFQNKKVGIVTVATMSTGLVTVTPLGTTGNSNILGGAVPILTGQSCIFFSAASGEGSDDPQSRRAEWIQSKNQVQIIKESGEITDLQRVAGVEVKYGGKNYIMYKVQMDALNRLKLKISNALTFGYKSKSGVNGALFDANGGMIITTQGLRPHIFGGDGTDKLTGGVTQQVAGAVAKTDYRALFRALDKRQAPKEYWAYVGGDLRADTDDLFGSGLGTTAAGVGLQYSIDFSSFGKGDSKKRAIDLGFDSVRIYGRTVHFNTMPLLDHSGLFGATNFDFGSEGYFIPCDKIKIDGGSGTQDRLSMRFMDGDGQHNFGKYHEAVTGKLAPTPTNSKSVLHVSYQAIVGLHLCGTDHFGAIFKTNATT